MFAKFKFLKTSLAVLLLLMIAGCAKYPNETERLLQDLAVFTQYDVGADFSEYSTFMITDSIAIISSDDTTRLKDDETQLIVDQIVKNMEARGYTLVEEDGDLAIGLAGFKNTNTVVYYPGWWWGYPGYYPPGYWGYPGYGYYYPYYPAYYTSYSSGTLSIELLDLKNAMEEEIIFIRWNSFIRGLLTGSHTASQVQQSIDQAFIQTPQLTK